MSIWMDDGMDDGMDIDAFTFEGIDEVKNQKCEGPGGGGTNGCLKR